jgi:hypothetical protein
VKLIRSLCGDTKTSSSPHLSLSVIRDARSLFLLSRCAAAAPAFSTGADTNKTFFLCCRTDNPRPDSTFVLCTFSYTDDQRKGGRKRDIIYKIQSLSQSSGLKLNSGLEKQEETAASFHVKNALLLGGFERFSISIFLPWCI